MLKHGAYWKAARLQADGDVTELADPMLAMR
jgi:hypothetical protein